MMNSTDVINWLFGGFSTDIEEQLAFYGAYHQNPYNQIIHIIFVPLIWGTACVWLAYTPKLFSGAPYWCNFSFLVYLAYAAYYLMLDFQTALVVDLFYFLVFLTANKIVDSEKRAAFSQKEGSQAKPTGKVSYAAAKWALALHILSWYMQIHPGHAVLEGRKPALLDSFLQSLTLAPLFVFYEVIWFFVPGFQAEMHHNVQNLIREVQANM